MMDPFEGRLTFLQLLRRLSASQLSQLKPAQFAVRHRELEEDLYSCIREAMESGTFNMRVNIMYFLETLCDMCRQNNIEGSYVEMIGRDIAKLVGSVVPPGQVGAANAPEVRKVLESMHTKRLLSDEQWEEANAVLQKNAAAQIQDGDSVEKTAVFSREDILRRMEEDRERHKRLRETFWAVDSPEEEWQQTWASLPALNDHDLEKIRDEYAKYKSCTQ
ncbi:domain kinase I gamma subunit [Schizosaccharomyces japonicus yFS275]|uniref:Domain kinase I gamma subunit n=1 Tax=Schizosaccharomyces japonicus (strain yFS275 / FY16936) TaxID=402676 RepID=B6JZW0_SCHJY|nr:domain kinase I gamma subunit [Schizosaccharomyces japonicus yFS275]EEB06110.1 domain kinase I gamma subunit [Schizosaccharomyces japonicus yFS275]